MNLHKCKFGFLFALIAGLAPLSPGQNACGGELTVSPERIVLDDAFARCQLIVDDNGQDATRAARYTVEPAGIVRIDQHGYLEPLAVGKATVQIQLGERHATLPVEVRQLNATRPVDFYNEVVPLLTRFGCNSGGCHGKALGQNGFKLSLFGYDPQSDYQEIVQNARGRRVSLAAPAQSLLLLKASAAAPHGGGGRIAPDSEAFERIRQWIANGAPRPIDDAPRVTGIHFVPSERTLAAASDQQTAVIATYSDGAQRDVTRAAQFESNDPTIASCDETGHITASDRSGEATIMSRYQNHIAVFRAVVPHGPVLADIPNFPIDHPIDALAAEKWKKLGMLPSPLADDSTFIRRVTLDLCGRLPTVAETRAFLESQSPNKRTELIDRLLESPDYAAFFAMRWGTILRNSPRAGADAASYAFHNWIKDMIARNRPYDEFVRGIVAASGEWQDAPAINWYWQMRDDQLHQVVGDTAQAFLGLRLQCAQCHHHPYERWSQDDYFGLAGFFTRLGRKSFGQPPPYYSSSRVMINEKHPRTGEQIQPKYLDGPEPTFGPTDDPRHALVDWMARKDNPYFAKAMVNRLWGHFFRRGIVEPVDDLRDTNPPSNPELLDYLAQEFVDRKFDVKHVIRTIVTSRAYQLDSTPNETNADDHQNFARYYPRRLIAEVLLDSVDQVCESKTRFSGVASSARAIDLPHEGFGSYFLDAFDRPKRLSSCECERSSAATLGQVLLLANSDEIENKIADGAGRIARLAKSDETPQTAIEELYLAAFSRPPNADELARALAFIESIPEAERRTAYEDLLWTLINSKEFSFNH